MFKILILFLFIGTLSNCASKKYTDVRVFRAVGTSHKIFGLENSGFVASKDCAWSILGVPLGSPSFEDAFENAITLKGNSMTDTISDEFSNKTTLTQSKIKLLTNIQTKNEGWNAIILGKSCIKLRAIAYK